MKRVDVPTLALEDEMYEQDASRELEVAGVLIPFSRGRSTA